MDREAMADRCVNTAESATDTGSRNERTAGGTAANGIDCSLEHRPHYLLRLLLVSDGPVNSLMEHLNVSSGAKRI